ncbi:MAG TPA: hypothetical protein VHH32_09530 [Gemmatimonadales bacterium]|nr:hypothetical protein [Gemmatimonadales bacterium]
MLSLATALLALSASWISIQPAPPMIMKYRIDQTLNQEIDATASGGAKEKIAFTTSSFVTVTLTDSAGGKTIRVVVDSIRGDSATPIPRAVLDSARGAEFRGFLDKSGKPTGLEPAGTGSSAVQIQSLVSDFFPWIRSNLRVGTAWADTTAQTNGVGTDSVTVRRVSTYKVVANETRASRKAVRVAQDFTSSVAGTQPTPQGPARIEGTGRGTGSYYIGTDGRYLGGSWRQQSSLKISGSFAPQPLPISIAHKTEVSTIK